MNILMNTLIDTSSNTSINAANANRCTCGCAGIFLSGSCRAIALFALISQSHIGTKKDVSALDNYLAVEVITVITANKHY
jgi:hypothetical protein